MGVTAEEEGVRADRAEARTVRLEARYRRSWWWWVVLLVYAVAVPSVVLAVSGWRQRQSEQVWCEVVVTLDDAYRAVPPQTPTGVQVASGIARVRERYGC